MDEQKEPIVALRDERGRFLEGGPTINPGGRPKGSVSLSTHLRNLLAEAGPNEGRTKAQELVMQLYKKAIADGDEASIKLIFQYMEGMPRQRIGLEGGEEGSPIVVTDDAKAAAAQAISNFLGSTPTDNGHPDNTPG